MVCLTAVVTVALGWSTAALPAETDQKLIAERARVIAARDIYQKKLVESPAPPSRTPPWRFRSGAGPRRPPNDLIARIVLYLAIGLASGLILVWLLGWLIRRRQASGPAGDAAGASPRDSSGTPTSLQAIEQLAESGELGPAVRGLLHLAVSFLAHQRGLEISESSTARELGQLLPRSEGELATLALLVDTVERSLFGGLPVDPPTYERCRKAYARMQT